MPENPLFRKTCTKIEIEMERLNIPGVALGIINGEETLTASFGVTNLENPLPVDTNTLFQIGSITKTVTATTMMRLVDRGLIDLDAPIRATLPDLRLSNPATAEKVTLRHVFTHTGGWLGDFFDDAGPGDNALETVVSRMDLLPQETPLGEVWSYNNAGFCLAGRIIEVLTGETYETAVKKLVLEPLGMERSFFFAQDAITYRVASGHAAVYPGELRNPEVLRPWWLARASNALGGLLSTVNDLLCYARFHLGNGTTAAGKRLLTPESVSAMQTPSVPAANGEFMGISWFLRDIEGKRILRHGSVTNGQMAMFLLVPQDRFALVVLTNSDRGNELYHPISRSILADFLGLVETDPQPIPATEEELKVYAGSYDSAAQILMLYLVGGALWLQVEPKGGFPTPDSPPSPAPPPTRLALCGKDAVIAQDEPFKGDRGEFLRNNHGNLTWFRFGGRVHLRK